MELLSKNDYITLKNQFILILKKKKIAQYLINEYEENPPSNYNENIQLNF